MAKGKLDPEVGLKLYQVVEALKEAKTAVNTYPINSGSLALNFARIGLAASELKEIADGQDKEDITLLDSALKGAGYTEDLGTYVKIGADVAEAFEVEGAEAAVAFLATTPVGVAILAGGAIAGLIYELSKTGKTQIDDATESEMEKTYLQTLSEKGGSQVTLPKGKTYGDALQAQSFQYQIQSNRPSDTQISQIGTVVSSGNNDQPVIYQYTPAEKQFEKNMQDIQDLVQDAQKIKRQEINGQLISSGLIQATQTERATNTPLVNMNYSQDTGNRVEETPDTVIKNRILSDRLESTPSKELNTDMSGLPSLNYVPVSQTPANIKTTAPGNESIPVKGPTVPKNTIPSASPANKGTSGNTNISKVIDTVNIYSNNLSEGAGQIQAILTDALVGALNDSQIATG